MTIKVDHIRGMPGRRCAACGVALADDDTYGRCDPCRATFKACCASATRNRHKRTRLGMMSRYVRNRGCTELADLLDVAVEEIREWAAAERVPAEYEQPLREAERLLKERLAVGDTPGKPPGGRLTRDEAAYALKLRRRGMSWTCIGGQLQPACKGQTVKVGVERWFSDELATLPARVRPRGAA